MFREADFGGENWRQKICSWHGVRDLLPDLVGLPVENQGSWLDCRTDILLKDKGYLFIFIQLLWIINTHRNSHHHEFVLIQMLHFFLMLCSEVHGTHDKWTLVQHGVMGLPIGRGVGLKRVQTRACAAKALGRCLRQEGACPGRGPAWLQAPTPSGESNLGSN